MKIAVAIPTMNRPGMLREAIHSALDQSRPPDEIFVSDNSKTPDSALLQDFPDAPLRYHFHERLLTIEEHWTWAICQPKADYVCWLEDDNLFRRNHLEVLHQAAQQSPSSALFGTAAVVFDDRNRAVHRPVHAPPWKADLLTLNPVELPIPVTLATYFLGSPIASSGVMLNKHILDAEPLIASGCRQPLDRWLWAQMAARSSTVYVPRQTVLYRVHGQQHNAKDSHDRHRQETRVVSRLILDLMQRLGIDPEAAVSEMLPWIDAEALDTMAYFILQQRDLELARRFLPILTHATPHRIPLLKTLGLLVRYKILPKFRLRVHS
jgi:glycosyl transferase family 2